MVWIKTPDRLGKSIRKQLIAQRRHRKQKHSKQEQQHSLVFGNLLQRCAKAAEAIGNARTFVPVLLPIVLQQRQRTADGFRDQHRQEQY